VQTKLRGTVLFLSSLLIFAVSDATAKYMSAFFAISLLAWARYTTQLVVMLAVSGPRMGRELVRTRRPALMIVRAAMQVASTVFILLAFQRMPLAETTAIAFIAPLLVALLAGALLGEKLRLHNWVATVAGFAGVLLIVRPGGTIDGVGVIFAFCSALTYAAYQVLTRKLAATEPALRQLFYIALVGVIAMSFSLPWSWPAVLPTPAQALLILSLGFYGGGGHFLLIRAFEETPASTLSPLQYIQLIWSTLLGWLVFGHFPDWVAIAGMAIIGASGLGLALFRPRY
jgi:drug/metabolite transporter (DMT)-like permease